MTVLLDPKPDQAALGGLKLVRRGTVDLFAVLREEKDDGAADGRRHFLCRIETGGWILPFSSPSPSWDLRLVPGLGSEIEERDESLCSLPRHALDQWAASLVETLMEGLGTAMADLALSDGRHEIPPGLRCGGTGILPVWAKIRSGRFRLRGQDEALADSDTPPLPLTRTLWVECLEAGEIEIIEEISEADIQAAVTRLHAHVAALIDQDLTLHASRIAERQKRRGDLSRQVREEGLRALATVADRKAPPPPPEGIVSDLAALHLLARHLDLPLRPPQGSDDGTNRLQATLKASGLRWRTVLLRGQWWRHDSGPLLAWWQKDDETDGAAAVALLPGAGGYELHDPANGTVRRVDEAVADALKGQARMLYRRLPDQPLGPAGLLRFGLHDTQGALRRLGWLGAFTALLTLSVPLATNLLVQEIIPRGMVDQHMILVAGLLAAALGAGSFQLVRFLTTLTVEGRLDWALQAGLFDRLLRMPAAFFSRYSAGDLADRVLGIQAIRERLSGAALTAMQSLLFSVFSLAALFFFDAKLALLGLVLAVTSLGVTLGLAALQLRHETRHADARGRVEGLVFQIMAGIGKLKTAAALDRAFSTWARLYAKQKRHFADASRVSNRITVFHALFPGLATLILLAVAVLLIEDGMIDQKLRSLGGADPDKLGGGLTPGAMMAFLAAFGQFLAALNGVGQSLTDVLGAVPLYRRARPLFDAVPEETGLRRDPGPLQGAVEFLNVSFAYQTGGPRLIQNLSLSIEPGEWIALVGPSGSGKSTLLRLLLGFERPDSGEIFLDGKPLADLDLAAVRRQTGVVLQNGKVSGGSILSNIVGSSGLGLEDAWTAARLVGLDRDIEAMPMGMHTPLMDGGPTLSGGQRQRLLLARAMIRRPRLLVLDEATSALDNRTQAVVTETLAALPITRIVIAHRLSSVEKAGRIVVLQQGSIVQQGKYHDLLATPGPFADMARRQTL
ncbi:NHLP bacteriocin export ABC transporter permease/ATPase subunit [Telmatospirillum sp. J64-1]|uniref:NHLP bacteriocin export ABC transporter permease/ATPase subunit n=1 Tax=Telmatospirillum sp. J64-1 TaxID=2502183 RepID=UPI00115D9374|nr:NHLP bacteriocin export ABC transporter permease/ATPase subunit [Telmatospirillum sp. J64-1]